MDPIISPWFFYGMEVFGGIDTACLTFGIISGIAWLALWIGGLCQFDEYSTFKENLENHGFKVCWKCGKKCMIAMLILISLVVIIPSKQTMVEMVVSKELTVNNIEKGKEAVKSATDYIFEKLKESKE